MAGGNPKGSSHKPSVSSSHRKSRWESGNKPPTDSKSGAGGDLKHTTKLSPNPNSNLTPNSGPKPSPGHSKVPIDQVPPSGPHPLPHAGLGAPIPFPDQPPPAYGFHMLDRRTFVLADGSVRSYFALPHDYQDFTPGGVGFDKRFPPVGPMSPEVFRGREDPFGRLRNQANRNPIPPEGLFKRKYGDEEDRDGRDVKDEFARQRQQLLQYGNLNSNPNGYRNDLAGTSSPFGREDMRASKFMRVAGGYENVPSRQEIHGGIVGVKHQLVDQEALKKAFFHYAKLINENVPVKKAYLEDKKQGPLHCLACGRSSKDFQDMHGLIMHSYNSDNTDLHVDHLGLHKALCILMGWNFLKAPENSKAYQFLSADVVAANRDDLIMWPPVVIIHNTITGKSKDGRMEGLGNKAMDSKLRDLGFSGGKSKSLYGKDGHLGITLVKFSADQSGLKEAVRLGEFFEKDNRGRIGWARAQSQSISSGKDDENNPNLVKVDAKTGEKNRVFYGYLGTAFDLDKVDFDTRKKAAVESRREKLT